MNLRLLSADINRQNSDYRTWKELGSSTFAIKVRQIQTVPCLMDASRFPGANGEEAVASVGWGGDLCTVPGSTKPEKNNTFWLPTKRRQERTNLTHKQKYTINMRYIRT